MSYRPGDYVFYRDEAVRTLRRAVDAFTDADDYSLGVAIAEAQVILKQLGPYGEVFSEPVPLVVGPIRGRAA